MTRSPAPARFAGPPRLPRLGACRRGEQCGRCRSRRCRRAAAHPASAATTGASAPSAGLGAPRKVPTGAIDCAASPRSRSSASISCSTASTDTSAAAQRLRRHRRLDPAQPAQQLGIDSDPFTINQLGHPYQGSMYHGFARSAGLRLLGVARLHLRRQRCSGRSPARPTPPVASTTRSRPASAAPSSARRCSAWRTCCSRRRRPAARFWRELGAAAISPSTGFNRLAFGDRFDAIFPSREPGYYSRLAVGASGTTQRGRSGTRPAT